MTVRNMRQGQAGGHPRRSLFTRFSQAVARYAGKPATFVTAAGLVAVWAATGPFVGYSETWQLVINTSTTIITFLMVFIIQNSQNRDTAAVQIKLDELISKLEGPREILLDLEELDEGELEKLRQEFEELACKARAAKGDKRHAERGTPG
ncbi:low affinity iron permease family protein [Ancylobacter sp. G4_0304]|uniref:low affinity iron permease family protein n=1 Tax=Ancylobacter sp. G4_0304 TaxID=3114289 RepID=UPI0039C649CC